MKFDVWVLWDKRNEMVAIFNSREAAQRYQMHFLRYEDTYIQGWKINKAFDHAAR